MEVITEGETISNLGYQLTPVQQRLKKEDEEKRKYEYQCKKADQG